MLATWQFNLICKKWRWSGHSTVPHLFYKPFLMPRLEQLLYEAMYHPLQCVFKVIGICSKPCLNQVAQCVLHRVEWLMWCSTMATLNQITTFQLTLKLWKPYVYDNSAWLVSCWRRFCIKHPMSLDHKPMMVMKTQIELDQ